MELTHTDLLKKLVATGLKWRYGNHPGKQVWLRYLSEMKHIIDAGFVDYYLMAFWIFRDKADSAGIHFWARGAVPSSIICYALKLTEIDPVKYGLHSVRFVNDDLPKFQFDIEASRFDEFMNRAEEVLVANEKDFDIESVRGCLFQDVYPSPYLNKKIERQIPDDLDDELARYALYFPNTMDLFDSYVRRKEGEVWEKTEIAKLDEILAPTYGILAYQEQMLDILKEFFECSAVERNHIRLTIQRSDTEQVERYKADLRNKIKTLMPPYFTTIIAGEAARRRNIKVIKPEEFETVWSVLVSNPRAFLKAHAVSRVIEKYMYDMKDRIVLHWKYVREFSEGLAALQVSSDKWGFIDQRGKVVIPCQWKDALFFSEGLAGVQDSSGKWGFIDQKGKLVIPYQWKFVHEAYFESLVGVQDINGKWGYIDKTGKMIIPCIWNRAYVFREGLAGVQDSEGKWGFIDKTGKVIIPCQWEGVNSFSEGWAGIMDSNGKWGFIDKIGKVVLPCKWSNVLFFIKGKARVQTSRFGDYHFIDKNGNDVQ